MRKTIFGALTLVAALFAIHSTAAAQARDFVVENNGGSRIQFVSDAELETITGVSSNVSGNIRANLANLAGATGTVSVPVSSIRTGIDLRDEHLRNPDWLDAARNPNVTFELTGIDGATAIPANETKEVTVRGRFTLHGQTHDITATARVRFVPVSAELREAHVNGDTLIVNGQFQIELDDYGVSINPIVRLKVSNTISVNFSLRGVTAPRAGRPGGATSMTGMGAPPAMTTMAAPTM